MRISKIRIIIVNLLLFASAALASVEKSDMLVNEAWDAWHDNNQMLVEQKFLSAIHENDQNVRAYVGLSYLYSLQERNVDAWNVFKKILDTNVDPYPYFFAEWISPMIRGNLDKSELGIDKLYLQFSEKADQGGVLRAMADEMLGEYYLDKGDYAKSEEAYARLNTINEWMLCGPFENISASGFAKQFPPETEYNAAAHYEGKNGVETTWFAVPKLRRDFWVDFRRYFAFDEAVYYANTFVYSPKK